MIAALGARRSGPNVAKWPRLSTLAKVAAPARGVAQRFGLLLLMTAAVGLLILGKTHGHAVRDLRVMAVEVVAPEHSGSSIGYISIGTASGAMIGPPLFGAMIDATGRFADGWLMTAAIVAAGVALFAYGFRERPANAS